MKFFLLSGMALMSIYAVAQQPKDSLPISKEKTEFLKNYSEYLLKTKANKPKTSIDSSVYFPKTEQVIQPKIKTNLPSEEITGTIKSGYKKSVEITPGNPQKAEKKVEVVKQEITKTPIVQEVKENVSTVPKQVKFIFDSTKENVAKVTIDSSVYFPKTEQVIQPKIKTNLPSEEITGTIKSGYKKSVEITPGNPQKVEKKVEVVKQEITKTPIVQEVKENVNTVPKQVKFIFDSTKENVAKVTIDSSVYFPKTQQTIQPKIKTNLPSEEITGTIKSGYKKSVEITPGNPQKNSDVLLPITTSSAIAQTSTATNIPFKKFEFKEQPAAKNPSVFVDTTQIKMGMGEDIVSTDLESKQITGTLLPDNKNNLIVPAKHVERVNDAVLQQTSTATNIPFKKFEFKEQPAAKNPSVFVDTTQIKMGMGEDIVSTDLESKQITGILLPNNKNNLIVPAKHVEKINTTTQEQANSNTAMNVGEAPVKPTNIDLRQVSGDYLSTYSLPPIEEKNNITSTSNNNSNYVDPFANYTIPNAKANYKSQYLTQGITLPKTIVEPLSPDSIQRKFVEDSLYHLRVYDSIRNANEQQQANNAAQQNMYQLNNPNTYQQPSNYNYVNNADATQNTVYHFYLTQTGHYSVSFSNNYFYLNVDERGVVKDYGLINNGYITKGIPDGKPIHVGNLYVGYNNSNKINNIAGVEVSYAFDGRINKVGNTYINYNYEGVMEKIGNVNITYNSNFTVYRFGPFGVNYDNYGNVLGVDENRGLIIFNK